jgi:hypothetical protein
MTRRILTRTALGRCWAVTVYQLHTRQDLSFNHISANVKELYNVTKFLNNSFDCKCTLFQISGLRHVYLEGPEGGGVGVRSV